MLPAPLWRPGFRRESLHFTSRGNAQLACSPLQASPATELLSRCIVLAFQSKRSLPAPAASTGLASTAAQCSHRRRRTAGHHSRDRGPAPAAEPRHAATDADLRGVIVRSACCGLNRTVPPPGRPLSRLRAFFSSCPGLRSRAAPPPPAQQRTRLLLLLHLPTPGVDLRLLIRHAPARPQASASYHRRRSRTSSGGLLTSSAPLPQPAALITTRQRRAITTAASGHSRRRDWPWGHHRFHTSKNTAL